MRSTDSGFNENVYLAAAQERINEARELLDAGRYVLAVYVAGVAVETLFFAYLHREGAEYDAKHDLRRFAAACHFFDGMTRDETTRLLAELGDVITRWRNNHRYRFEAAFRAFLVQQKLHVVVGATTVCGDVVIYNADIAVEAAARLVTAGVARWSL